MAEKQTLDVGQIVRLKSGGPEMTVEREYTNYHDELVGYHCQWFAGKKLESGQFPTDSLEIVEPEDGK